MRSITEHAARACDDAETATPTGDKSAEKHAGPQRRFRRGLSGETAVHEVRPPFFGQPFFGRRHERPGMDKPHMGKPGMDKPGMDKPLIGKPHEPKPAVEKPINDKSRMGRRLIDKRAVVITKPHIVAKAPMIKQRMTFQAKLAGPKTMGGPMRMMSMRPAMGGGGGMHFGGGHSGRH